LLQTNTTLEVLELNGNVIDYEGIGAIAEALTQNTSLKTLGLRWEPLLVLALCCGREYLKQCGAPGWRRQASGKLCC